MNVVCKKNAEIRDEELSVLYDISFSNNSNQEKMISKEDWIDLTKKDNNLLCFEFFNEEEFVGYVLISMLENENFVSAFEIMKKYQSDGKTFKEMIRMLLPYTNTKNIYTGIIFNENHHAQIAFKSIGAIPDKNKYKVSYDRLNEFLDKNIVFSDEMKPLDNK